MKRVLVASDLTSRSESALERALILAKQVGAAVHVLHVVDAELPRAISEHQRTEGMRQLEEWLANSPNVEGVQVEIEVVLGHRIDSVLTGVDAKNAELLILGRQRKRLFRDAFAGSTMEQLVRLSQRPVLVVPHKPTAPYQRMLAAIDFSDCSRRAVEYALQLLPQASLELLHVYAMSYTGIAGLSQGAEDHDKIERHIRHMVAEDEKRFLAAIKTPGAPQQVDLRAGNAIAVIRQEVASRGADLLVIGTSGRRGLARAMLGSVAAKLTQDPVCDVLVVS